MNVCRKLSLYTQKRERESRVVPRRSASNGSYNKDLNSADHPYIDAKLPRRFKWFPPCVPRLDVKISDQL